MRILISVLAIVTVIVSGGVTLKNPFCGQQPFANYFSHFSCSPASTKWSYLVASNQCKEFNYGGCGGNENRFSSLGDCQQSCVE